MKEISLTFKRKRLGCADGIFSVHAPDCIMAELFWADQEGKPLPGWTPFAAVPLNCGKGEFTFGGGRAIPAEAKNILCRAVSDDCSQILECLQSVEGAKTDPFETGYCFAVASDLHISNKAAPFDRLYEFASGADGLLLAGDTVNDGTWQQFRFVKDCIMENCKKQGTFLPIYTAAGNHDILLKPLPSMEEGQAGYPGFQGWLQKRAEEFGIMWDQDASGAYAARAGEQVEIIGLQCVSHFRRFVFPEGRQLDWLDNHLEETKELKWHIILCHAPLIKYNPQRKPGKDAPYLSRDDKLQSILDAHHNIIFISGHTHFSLNQLSGCVCWDDVRENLYLNVGSIRKTTMNSDELPVPSAWTEGDAVLLRISENGVEVKTVGLYSGKKQSRGYYRFESKGNYRE